MGARGVTPVIHLKSFGGLWLLIKDAMDGMPKYIIREHLRK